MLRVFVIVLYDQEINTTYMLMLWLHADIIGLTFNPFLNMIWGVLHYDLHLYAKPILSSEPYPETFYRLHNKYPIVCVTHICCHLREKLLIQCTRPLLFPLLTSRCTDVQSIRRNIARRHVWVSVATNYTSPCNNKGIHTYYRKKNSDLKKPLFSDKPDSRFHCSKDIIHVISRCTPVRMILNDCSLDLMRLTMNFATTVDMLNDYETNLKTVVD
uniref:Uncharacterized protein n=1 Tax=Glossina pallidipes TaxID=7398 RepID=A0A1A9Z734_GLOPL